MDRAVHPQIIEQALKAVAGELIQTSSALVEQVFW